MSKAKTGYCWKCADEFPMSELVEDDDPYIKDETDPNDKNYQCRACAKKDEDEDAHVAAIDFKYDEAEAKEQHQ